MENKSQTNKKDKIYEMNIRIGSLGVDEEQEPINDMPLKLLEDPVIVQRTKECAFAAINDGYTHLVYNLVRSGATQLTDRDICTFKGFDLE
mgnify:CR=1 FL=1